MTVIRKKTGSYYYRVRLQTPAETEAAKLRKRRWPGCSGIFPDCPEFIMSAKQRKDLLNEHNKPDVCRRCPWGWTGSDA